MRKWQRPLTDEELASVLAGVKEAPVLFGSLEAAIVGVISLGLREVYGAEWEDMPSIDPTEFAIPEEQWKTICQALVERGLEMQPGGDARVHLAMDWMNIGPSAYNPAWEGRIPAQSAASPGRSGSAPTLSP